ncbi:MAG: heat-inducible transcriptional repressor HrcA, partial [Asticcacaulis sp.]|nr:heat-inducible transcriptional repressor HrcA [Asticcacaulis sp.]
MKTSLSTLMSGTASLTELDARAREVFRHVVEAYLETGEP